MARNRYTTKLVNDLLHFGVSGGILTASLLLPGAAVLTEKLLGHLEKPQREAEYKRLLRLMKRQALVDIVELADGTTTVKVTEKGQTRVRRLQFEAMRIHAPAKWDEKWRMVIFDIPESHKSARNELVSKLRELGFTHLQHSVWLHPFPCLEEISLIKQAYGLEPYVSLATVADLDTRNQLLKRFHQLLLPYA